MQSWAGPGYEANFTLGEHKILLAANILALLWTVVLHKFAPQEIPRIRYVTFGMENKDDKNSTGTARSRTFYQAAHWFLIAYKMSIVISIIHEFEDG